MEGQFYKAGVSPGLLLDWPQTDHYLSSRSSPRPPGWRLIVLAVFSAADKPGAHFHPISNVTVKNWSSHCLLSHLSPPIPAIIWSRLLPSSKCQLEENLSGSGIWGQTFVPFHIGFKQIPMTCPSLIRSENLDPCAVYYDLISRRQKTDDH